MFNLMKADIQRLFRGKAIYIVLSVLVGLIGMHILGFTQRQDSHLIGSGATMPFFIMRMVDNFSLLLIFPVTLLVVEDFSTGTVKNILSSGFSRKDYYLSKLLLSYLFITILYVSQLLIGTLAVTIFFGFGGSFDGAYLLSVLQPMLAQLVVFLGMATFGVAISFLLRKDNVILGLYWSILFLPSFAFSLLSMSDGNMQVVEFLQNFEIFSTLQSLVSVADMPMNDLVRILTSTLAAIVICTGIGMSWLRKAEIK